MSSSRLSSHIPELIPSLLITLIYTIGHKVGITFYPDTNLCLFLITFNSDPVWPGATIALRPNYQAEMK